jgi:RHS repeat-associated protein
MDIRRDLLLRERPSRILKPSADVHEVRSAGTAIDANGNTLSDAQGRSFTWDFENRLTQVVNPGVGTTTFKYDPFGRRIQKSGPLGTTNYLYSGLSVIEEVDNSGNVNARYTHGPEIDQPLAEFQSGVTSYYQQDALSSATSVSSSAGALAATYTYDSFGKLIASTGTLTNPFQYTGRESDPETALYYYRARYYDPQIGRFISEDPIQGGLNFYAYVKNDPVRFTDPSGLKGCCNARKIRWAIFDWCADRGWTSLYVVDCTGDHDCCIDKQKEFGKECEAHNDPYDKKAGVKRYEYHYDNTQQVVTGYCCKKW